MVWRRQRRAGSRARSRQYGCLQPRSHHPWCFQFANAEPGAGNAGTRHYPLEYLKVESIPELLITVPEAGVPDPPVDTPVQIWHDYRGIPCAVSYRLGAEYWFRFPGLGHFKFCRGDNKVIGIPTRDADPEAITDTFQRHVVPIVLQVRGFEALHASAISSSAGTTAFCGVSGVGKSTLAFALSRRGYRHWADDAVVFTIEGTSALAVPIPFTSRLRASAMMHFGTRPERRSTSLHTPPDDTSPVPLKSICILERWDSASAPAPIRLERLSASAALAALLEHAYCFTLEDQKRKQETLRNYLELVAEVPIYRLTFVPDLNYLPRVQDEVERLFQAT